MVALPMGTSLPLARWRTDYPRVVRFFHPPSLEFSRLRNIFSSYRIQGRCADRFPFLSFRFVSRIRSNSKESVKKERGVERANLWLNSNYVRSAVLGALNHSLLPMDGSSFAGEQGGLPISRASFPSKRRGLAWRLVISKIYSRN